MKKRLRCILKVLSPLHIGCDQVYEPMSFILDEEKGEIVAFDPFSFISEMDPKDKQEFSRICSQGTISSILEVYRFLRGRKAEGKHVDVCPGFLSHFEKTVSIPLDDTKRIKNELNRFEIKRTAFNSLDERPYIPGSSIKGALRTAYLNEKASSMKIGSTYSGKSAAKNLEKDLLNGGSFDTDPFRMVKVSDFRPIGEMKTQIMYAVNKKKASSEYKASGLSQILEVIKPGAEFEGWITVDSPQKGAGINTPASLEDLLRSCGRFYSSQKDREDKELRGIGVKTGIYPEDQNKAALIRMGQHSGAECVTIEGHREIKIMRPRTKKYYFGDRSTTIWLASPQHKPRANDGLQPFGWALLIEMTGSMAEGISAREREWQKRAEAERDQKRATEKEREKEKEAEEERLAKEKRRQAEETEEKRLAEEKRKAQLESMSPAERAIAKLNESSTTEQEAVEIYSAIDDFSDDDQRAVARALKEYWQALDKWSGSKLSKKQKQKVRKIRNILEA